MFQTVYSVKRILQVPAISRWRYNGGETSERGLDSAVVNTRGIFDEKGRLLVLMTHNTDISDTWEREGEDVESLLPLLAGRICDRHQRDALRDDPLEHIKAELRGFPRPLDPDRQHRSRILLPEEGIEGLEKESLDAAARHLRQRRLHLQFTFEVDRLVA